MKFPKWSAASCFFALLLGACHQSAAPVLQAREWRAWVLPSDGAMLPTPRSVAVGSDDSLATLDTAGRVLIYQADGQLRQQWKMLDVSVGKPEGIVILNDGRVVVCDTHYHRLAWFDQKGTLLFQSGKKGEGPGEFIYPVGICKDAQENLYVCEYGGNDRIQKFTREGKWLVSFGKFGTGPGEFQRPSGLAWRDGRLYVADAINNRVMLFNDDGKYLGLLGREGAPLNFELPYDIAFGGDGLLYVIEYGAGRLSQVTSDGRLLARFGKTGSGEGEFATPWGIVLDSKNRIHVADTRNRRIVTLKF
ncbi:MAG: transporter-related protein [Chthoniobacteraceae bacterium]|nr:transporter-related protein [Chthoniobacteraceae bacterium]